MGRACAGSSVLTKGGVTKNSYTKKRINKNSKKKKAKIKGGVFDKKKEKKKSKGRAPTG